MDANELLKAHIVKEVLKRRYSDFLKWRKPVLFRGIGPYHPTVFDHYTAYALAAVESSAEILEEKSLEELEDTFDHMGLPNSESSRLSEQMLHAESSRVRATKPVWFAGGFNVLGRESDPKYWTRMKRWDLLETVAISIGFEPCGDIFEDANGRACQDDVAQFYLKRLALFEDNFNWKAPKWGGKQEVEELCCWMRDVELEVPENFLNEAGLFFGWKPKSVKQRTVSKNAIDPREHKTMLRLIIGLAIGGYSFNPSAQRSKIPREISDDLDRLGLSLDIDTIRKYLSEGRELLPPELLEDETRFPKKD